MGRTTSRHGRRRGRIEELPSGSLRVVVYAGIDPVSKKRHFLRELVPAGPKAHKEAERVLRRLASEIDEDHSPKTSATVGQLLDEHFALLEVERTTRATYETLTRVHVRPLIGKQKVGALRASVFDAFYAELRRCRQHCDRRDRSLIDHRTPAWHTCDDRCGPHRCKPLSRATIRQIHVILSGALRRAVRWGWIGRNPIENAEAPPQPTPKPRPPSAEEAARILKAASDDPAWGVLVWLTMVTGFRRGELCGLRWQDVDPLTGTLSVERSIGQLDGHTWEKDTKTHHQRRIALDEQSSAVLQRYHDECRATAVAAGVELADDAFVFSTKPDGSTYLTPRSVSQRYTRLARRLGIHTTIHKLRHYSATELISAGVDIRTVAGRLGHGGGGTTTLRVYAAWVSEADQRAARSLAARLPTLQ